MIPMGQMPIPADAGRGWREWVHSLQCDEPETMRDLVCQLLFEGIVFGGGLGPNGNTYQGIDEGEVMTRSFIDGWARRFEDMMRPKANKPTGTCEMVGYVEGFMVPDGSLWPNHWTCSECGCKVLGILESPCEMRAPVHCPACGRECKPPEPPMALLVEDGTREVEA